LEPRIAHLVTMNKFAIPIAMVSLAVYLDVELSGAADQREIKGEFFDVILGDGRNGVPPE
jgi:hypothetical protein